MGHLTIEAHDADTRRLGALLRCADCGVLVMIDSISATVGYCGADGETCQLDHDDEINGGGE